MPGRRAGQTAAAEMINAYQRLINTVPPNVVDPNQYRQATATPDGWRTVTYANETIPNFTYSNETIPNWVTGNYQFNDAPDVPQRNDVPEGEPMWPQPRRTPKECNPATPKGEYEMDAD